MATGERGEPHTEPAVDDVAEGVGDAVAEVEQALTVPPDLLTAAFFDVDNTIMRGASIFQMARGLYRRKFLTWRDIAHFAWQQTSFLLRGENLDHVQDVQAKALSFVAGHSMAELRAVGEEIYDELMADKIWPGPYALARIHMDAGQRVWLVTATPVEVAEVIAARLGLTGALGTVAEHVDGIYTGGLVGGILHGQAKADAVRALAERDGRAQAYLDLALPRDIDPAVADLDGATLVDLEALGQVLAAEPIGAEIAEVRRLVAEEVEVYLGALRVAQVAPTVVALRGLASKVVEAELARMRSRLGDGVDDRVLGELEQTVHRVVEKLLHSPTVRVKELAAEPNGDSYAAALRELFGLDLNRVAAVTTPGGIS